MVNANKFKGALANAGYTQKTLAEKIGISPNSMCQKINGRAQFTIDEVDEICTALGVSDIHKKAEIFLA